VCQNTPTEILTVALSVLNSFNFWHRISSYGVRITNNLYYNINNNKINFSSMNIKPLADRVLVKPAAAEEKTISGIIIPDTAKEKPLKGEVIAVGKGTKDEEMVVKEGEQVLYGKYAGTEIEVDGEKLLIMRQSDILAILS
jgi:chaperonin GroES